MRISTKKKSEGLIVGNETSTSRHLKVILFHLQNVSKITMKLNQEIVVYSMGGERARESEKECRQVRSQK
jgi:hypothetical protein